MDKAIAMMEAVLEVLREYRENPGPNISTTIIRVARERGLDPRALTQRVMLEMLNG